MKIENLNNAFYIFIVFVLLTGCDGGADLQETKPIRVLPILGHHDTELIVEDGREFMDTIYHQIPDFFFTAHTGEKITRDKVAGKIYVADFFFTHCPSICPVMTMNLDEFHKATEDIEELVIISHTIDPERDSIERLNEYIEMRNIDTRDDWFFVRGSQEYTYNIGKYDYLINADIDPEAEGGFLHSEHFVLIDREGRIRGMYEGTDPNQVKQLELDIRKLIKVEYGE